jgi:cytochrome c-type biogenesis protein CcmH/NrfG
VVHIATIALITLATYSGSFDGELVSDDIRLIRDEALIRSLDWDNLRRISTSFYGPNYLPVTVLSLAVDYRLFGLQVAGYHATNLGLHIGCALLVYALLLRLRFTPLVAWATALLWAVHPLQVESVAWISERKNVLSGLFFFAAFYLFVGYADTRRARSYLGMLVLYSFAVLAKMNAIVLPAVCLAYEATFCFRPRARSILAMLPLFAVGAAVVWYTVTDNPIHAGGYHGGSPVVTWLSSAVVIFRYLGSLVAPIHLTPKYVVTLYGSLLDPPVLAAVTGLCAIAAGAIWLLRRRSPAAFWILWFGITLAPMLNIIPFRSMMQDRYMYLPMLGPLALAATALSRVRRPAGRIAVSALVAAASLACAGLSYVQVEAWSSPLSLYLAEARYLPLLGPDPPYLDPEQAAKVDALRAAAREDPSSAVIHNNLGALYFSSGRLDEAIVEIEAALVLEPTNPRFMLALGRAYAHAGRLADARDRLERAVALDPFELLGRLSLARLYLRLGEADAARREIEACVRIAGRDASPAFLRQERLLLQRLEASTDPAS